MDIIFHFFSDNLLPSFFLFCILHILIFFITHNNIQLVFRVIYRLTKLEKFTYLIVSFIFLPGTIVHEFAHFAAATILLLRVKDFSLIPQIHEKEMKLGHVIYERKDIFRGTLVGVAPLFGAWFIFCYSSLFRDFIVSHPLALLFFFILLFCISATMFSSQQDMIDAVITLPVFLLIIIAALVAHIDIFFFLRTETISQTILYGMNTISLYLLLSLAIHIAIRVALLIIIILLRL